MAEWVTNIVNSMGYPGIVLLMLLENVFPPIPSELIMPLAGFTAGQGGLSFVGVVLAGTLGSVLGALPLYYLGRVASEERLKRWADRYGKWLTVSSHDVEKAVGWFDRHGGKAVFFCRLVPGIRSLISIPAGMARMNLIPFLLYTTIGTGIWAALLAWAGWLLGENYDRVKNYVGPVAYVVIGVIVVGFVAWLIYRKTHASKTPDEKSDALPEAG